eukprot:5716445-Heterocapsa_arctica.AAC.1
MAIQIEHSERNASAAPGASSTDPLAQVRTRTPYEEIKTDMILDGVVKAIAHNGISMDKGHTRS